MRDVMIRVGLAAAFLCSLLISGCANKSSGQVTAVLLLSAAPDAGPDDLSAAVHTLVNRVARAGGRVKLESGPTTATIQVVGIPFDFVTQFVDHRGVFYLAELSRDGSGNVLVHQLDGSVRAMDLYAVLQSPDLIQRAEFKPILVSDSTGVMQRLDVRYFVDPKKTLSRVGLPVLDFTLTDSGAQLMRQATMRLSNPPQPIEFVLDGTPVRGADGHVIAPLVQSAISNEAQISGLTSSDTDLLVAILGTGEVPSSVTISVRHP